MSDPVQSEAARGEWPQEFHAGALAEIHEQMEKGGGESGEEHGKWRSLLFRWSTFAKEKKEGDEKTEQQSREQGMTIRAIEREERGGASKFAQRVHIGDGSRNEHGNGVGASDAGESGAL